MKTRNRTRLRAAVTVACSAFLVGGPGGAQAQVVAGDIAPEFELESVDGQLVSLGDFRDEKVVFLNILGNT
jgi:hypothetical protein